mmetsp:Transcript_24481/g.61652  ORF Transcript_24481/g.61652 Transcript_24481/m.61652 type:complete len:342 (+) Transcript_24481:216-1241(+)
MMCTMTLAATTACPTLPRSLAASTRSLRSGSLALPRGFGMTADRSPRLQPARATKGKDSAGEGWEEQLKSRFPMREPGEFPDLDVHPKGWLGMTMEDGEEEYDPLRDGPLRYLGYANELGEAFAAFLPPAGVPLSYAVAIAYVLVDTFDKGRKAKVESAAEFGRKADALPPSLNADSLSTILAAERTLDTVVWQLLASVAIPGFTIHQVVHYTHAVLDPFLAHLSGWELDEAAAAASALHMATSAFVAVTDKAVPTAIGLATIPFIVHPIDEGVHGVLDLTLRPLLRNVICTQMQGDDAGLDMCAECEAPTADSKEPGALANAAMLCVPLGLLIAAAQLEG